ncbi:MAG: GTPase HflX [Planctomycetota bacterium]
MAILLPHTKADLRDPLGELKALTESAGVEVLGGLIQKRLAMQASTGLGKGKVAELAELVQQAGANVVVVDNDLAPRQIRELEEAVGCKVLDRSELILDIFASRAKTHEAQLQVELAQLEYTAPRLRGMWTHLERIAGAGGGTGAGVVGGVGTRGPGERQIEIDRRLVRDRISHLRREIRSIDERKRREVAARSDQFTVSIVGYTNSGKSTLMNRLAGADQFAADMLFATLDTKTVRWSLGDGMWALLSDTVGFVRDIPHKLVASFRATLEEAIHANLLLHVVDASSPMAWRQIDAVDEVLTDLGCDQVPQILVLNKTDVADPALLAELNSIGHRQTIQTSAMTGDGIPQLVEEVSTLARGGVIHVTVRIPHREGKLLSHLEQLATISDRRYQRNWAYLDLRMNRSQFRQLLGRYPSMEVVKGHADSLTDGESDSSKEK